MQSFISIASELGVSYCAAIISPGPSLILILRNSLLSANKRYGIWTAIGVVSGIALQALYVLIGLNTLHSYPILLQGLHLLCGGVLGYLGIRGVLKHLNREEDQENLKMGKIMTNSFDAFRQGFYVDVLNPLALAFFFAIFSLFIPQNASINYKLFCWIEIVFLGLLWYVGISYISSFPTVKFYIEKVLGKKFNFLASLLLIFFALKIIFLN